MKEIFYKIAFAATSESGPGGIVPCTDNCDLSQLGNLLVKIFNFLIWLVVPLAILGIAVGGLYIILGSSNPSSKTEGQSIIWYSILGLILAVAAWLIVNTVLVSLGAGGFKNPLKSGIF